MSIPDEGNPIIHQNPLPVMPLFPDFSTLSCQELNEHVESYTKEMLAESDESIKNAYKNGIEKAQGALVSKGCNKKPVVLSGVPVKDTKTSAVVPVTASKKKGMNTLLFAVSAFALGYLVFGGKKS